MWITVNEYVVYMFMVIVAHGTTAVCMYVCMRECVRSTSELSVLLDGSRPLSLSRVAVASSRKQM